MRQTFFKQFPRVQNRLFLTNVVTPLFKHRSCCVSACNNYTDGVNVSSLDDAHDDSCVDRTLSKQHSLNVAIIGAPNAGKSTLANKLLGQRFAAVSKRVHTTRQNALGFLTSENTQIVLLDTPGITGAEKIKKHKLDKSIKCDPHAGLSEADLALVVVDVAPPWNRIALDREVLKALTLHRGKLSSVLVLNKVDLLKRKTELLNITRCLTAGVVDNTPVASPPLIRPQAFQTVVDQKVDPRADWQQYESELNKVGSSLKENASGWPGFEAVYMISAIDGNGVDEIKDHLFRSAVPRDWQYPSNKITNVSPKEMCHDAVFEQLLEHLPDNVPYQMKLKLSSWEEDPDNLLRVQFDLICSKPRLARECFAENGTRLRRIASGAKQSIMNILNRELTLKLAVTPTYAAQTRGLRQLLGKHAEKRGE